MPHRAPAGRHRRATPRHRAPRPHLAAALPGRAADLTGERGRTALLAAALGGALIAGVAGGTAAAAAEDKAPDGITTMVTNDPGPADAVETAPREFAPAKPAPELRFPTDLGAAPGRQKARAKPPAAPARAAWVNPMPTGRITSCFGPRWGREHQGVDLAAPHGTTVVAAGAGVVVTAGENGGYGLAVLIDHGNGYLTHYGHLSAVTVRPGDRVAAGREIGNEGSTGHSTGPHLHFEVHQGAFKNPLEPTAWMRSHGVEIPGCVSS